MNVSACQQTKLLTDTCLAEGKCFLVGPTLIIVYKDHQTVMFIVKQYVIVNGGVTIRLYIKHKKEEVI